MNKIEMKALAEVCVATHTNDRRHNPAGASAGEVLYALVEGISVDEAMRRLSVLDDCLDAVIGAKSNANRTV